VGRRRTSRRIFGRCIITSMRRQHPELSARPFLFKDRVMWYVDVIHDVFFVDTYFCRDYVNVRTCRVGRRRNSRRIFDRRDITSMRRPHPELLVRSVFVEMPVVWDVDVIHDAFCVDTYFCRDYVNVRTCRVGRRRTSRRIFGRCIITSMRRQHPELSARPFLLKDRVMWYVDVIHDVFFVDTQSCCDYVNVRICRVGRRRN
jgi:hypothetical protein